MASNCLYFKMGLISSIVIVGPLFLAWLYMTSGVVLGNIKCYIDDKKYTPPSYIEKLYFGIISNEVEVVFWYLFFLMIALWFNLLAFPIVIPVILGCVVVYFLRFARRSQKMFSKLKKHSHDHDEKDKIDVKIDLKY